MSVLFDTNVVSELARPQPNPTILAYCGSVEQAYLSVVTMHELYYGAHAVNDSARQEKLLGWITQLRSKHSGKVIPVNLEIAENAAIMRANERLAGRILAVEDSLIAATADVYSLSVVTRNTKDFQNTGIHLINPWKN